MCPRPYQKVSKSYWRVQIKGHKYRLYEDPLQNRVYFLSFINWLKIILSLFNKTYMFIMTIHL